MSERKVSKFVKKFPNGWDFDIDHQVPRGGEFDFILASMKMSNSPGSGLPPPALGLNIDRCISPIYFFNLA